MPKFKKKPVVIEAEQYTEYGKLVKGMCNSQTCFTSGNDEPHVHTIHANQIVRLEVGDWVIPEPDGVHFYPIKNDIFLETYEALQATDPRGLLSGVMPGYDADSLTVDDWYSMLVEARNGDDTDKLFDLASDLLMLVVKWQLKAS